MTRTLPRVHQHLDPELRRVLEFAVAYPILGPSDDDLIWSMFHLTRRGYSVRLERALVARSTLPEEIGLAAIVRARRNDPERRR